MRRWWLGVLGLLAACADETVSVPKAAGGGGGGSSPAEPAPVPECRDASDCDDGDACTRDACKAGVCSAPSLIVSSECRPQIDIESPMRGATLQSASREVEVVGRASSAVGPIASATLNGEPLTVADDGSFTHQVTARHGLNVLEFEVHDGEGQTRRRVQSFLWSSDYRQPGEQVLNPGVSMSLHQDALDDGARGQPIDDLASLADEVIDGIDLEGLVDGDDPLGSAAGYDIYLTGLDVGNTSTAMEIIDGGVSLRVMLIDIEGDLRFDCTAVGCRLAGGDSSGGLTLGNVTVTADAMLRVDEHRLALDLENVRTTVGDLDLRSDRRWTNFLLSLVEPFIRGRLFRALEDTVDDQLTSTAAPLLERSLAGLRLDTTLPLPNLANPGRPIRVALSSDFASLDAHDGLTPPMPSPPQSIGLRMRTRARASDPATPYRNLGVPLRLGCDDATAELPRAAPLAVVLPDDTLNALLYAGWQGGLLEFPMTLDLGALGRPSFEVSGMLAPTATDCAGSLVAGIGDIRVDVPPSLGLPTGFTVYASVEVGVELSPTEHGSLRVNLTGVDNVWLDVEAVDDAGIEAEEGLATLMKQFLPGALLDGLGGLGEVALPTIDLSSRVGLPAGTAVLSLVIDDTEHRFGSTVVSAHLGR